jgi:type IV secretion system protein VirD4
LTLPRGSAPAKSSTDAALDLAFVALLGGLLGFGLTFWLATAISAAAFGDGWPTLTFEDLVDAVVALPSHLADPAQAWPRESRAGLSGPAALYGAFAALLLGLVALARTSVRLWRRFLSDSHAVPVARWAARADLRSLQIRARDLGRVPRVVLGRIGSHLVAAEERASVLVVAPPQSGKTTGLAIPAILEWPGPVLATSVKTDLLRETLVRRHQLGTVDVFDPTATTGLSSASWTPLGSCGSWHGAQRMAGWLCESARTSNLDEADFWYAAASKLLAPLLYAAATSGVDMETVVRWIDRQEEPEVERALELAEDRHALDAAQANVLREERQRSSIYTTAETILAAYADPRVMAAARRPDISPVALLDGGKHTLYLAGPAHEQRRLAPVFAALVEEVVAVAYELHSAAGRPLDPPLLIVGDELANIAPIRSLPQIASTGAGQGIQLVSILQDLAQLEERWGRSWRTVASAHRAKLFGTGIGDPGTLAYVRELTGESEYEQRSDTSGFLGQHSQTVGTTYRSIAPSHVVRESDPGTAVLVYGNLPPARLRLRQWFADRRLSGLASVGRGRQLPRHGVEEPIRGRQERLW